MIKSIIPPIPICPTIRWTDLRPGDCLFQHGTSWLSNQIEDFTNSPWSHNTMVINDPNTGLLYDAEMVWPKLKMTPLRIWLDANTEVWVCRLTNLTTNEQQNILWNWWSEHLGNWYDVGLMFQLAPLKWWQKKAQTLNVPISWQRLRPHSHSGVCSVCCARAWRSAKIHINMPCSLATPADIALQTFLQPMEKVQI
jgi:Permuted papain-like amidase enzyme, YaeF/YiiX, C92 family